MAKLIIGGKEIEVSNVEVSTTPPQCDCCDFDAMPLGEIEWTVEMQGCWKGILSPFEDERRGRLPHNLSVDAESRLN